MFELPLFSMWWAVAGAAAIAIPVVIHLLHRQRTTPLAWGAMQFLVESPLQLKRRKRVDHWLLMLLRMLAMAVLAFLLVRPIVTGCSGSGGGPLGAGLATDIGVVIDRSVSTGRKADAGDGDRTVFHEAVAAVEKLRSGMRPNDTISVVLAEHRPQVVTPHPVGRGNADGLLQKLKDMKPGQSDASIPDAVHAVREVINKGRNVRKMIVVISDEQRNGWQIENNSAWRLALGERAAGADKGVTMYAYGVQPNASASDVSVGDVKVTPSLVGVNRPVQVTATVSNSGPGDVAGVSVQLMVQGEAVGAQTIAALPAGQTRTVRFKHTFAQPGSSWVKVQANATDALEADNTAVAAVNVWEKLPVLVIDGQLTNVGKFHNAQFLAAAMQSDTDAVDAPTLMQPKLVGVTDTADVKLEDYPVVIVNDVPQLPDDLLVRLADYAKAGNAVWFIFGPRSQQNLLGQQLATVKLFGAQVKKIENSEKAIDIEVRDPNNPMVSLIMNAGRNALTGAVTKQWWSVSPTDPDNRVVVATATGDPLVLERPVGRGRICVWLTSADAQWNNWPAMRNFTPLVNETLYHLAATHTGGTENRRLEAGQAIVWSGKPGQAVQKVQVTRPDDTKADLNATLSGGRYTVSYNDTFMPGRYELRFPEKTEVPQPVYYGVGIDPRELDNATLSEADLKWLKDRNYLEDRLDQAKLGSAVGTVNRGPELWPFLALALLGTLLFETFMTRRMIKFQSKVDVAHAGMVGPPAAA